jgi:cell division septum initiation protein DivIVA
MPEVLTNISESFANLDKIDALISDIKKTPEQYIDEVTNLKQKIDDSTAKVEQSEALVSKLRNEMIEWDPHKKLCRRDDELKDIIDALDGFKIDLYQEQKEM